MPGRGTGLRNAMYQQNPVVLCTLLIKLQVALAVSRAPGSLVVQRARRSPLSAADGAGKQLPNHRGPPEPGAKAGITVVPSSGLGAMEATNSLECRSPQGLATHSPPAVAAPHTDRWLKRMSITNPSALHPLPPAAHGA